MSCAQAGFADLRRRCRAAGWPRRCTPLLQTTHTHVNASSRARRKTREPARKHATRPGPAAGLFVAGHFDIFNLDADVLFKIDKDGTFRIKADLDFKKARAARAPSGVRCSASRAQSGCRRSSAWPLSAVASGQKERMSS